VTDAVRWLSDHVDAAPANLRARMLAALTDAAAHASIADQLADAARACLERALQAPAQRASALELLTADALFTHALQAAAEAGDDSFHALAGAWNAARFEQLLSPRGP